MKHMMLPAAIAGSAASVLIALFVAPPGNGYRIAPVFLVPLIWIVYALRRHLHLTPLLYAAFVSAVLFHNYGGARGYYQQRIWGINFDAYVHTYFGFVGGLLFHRLIARSIPVLRLWQVAFATLLCVMGSGAIHELVEYASTLVLGPEKGMLKSESVAPFDTQRDLLSNLIGVTVAIATLTVVSLRGREARGPGFDVAPAVPPTA